MSGTFFGLEIGKRALQANKTGMDVTGNNVANANTTGYSRQRVNLVTGPPYTGSGYQLGTGVNVGDIERIRNNYIDGQVRSNLSQIGYQEKEQNVLQKVEALFPYSVNEGMQVYLNDFFNGWQEVNENPLDKGIQAGVLEKGKALAAAMNQSYEQLGIIRKDVDTEHTDLVSQVGKLTERIVKVNESIAKSHAENNNVLLDERDLLLDRLAKLVKIDATMNNDNKALVDVSVNGVALITGTANNFNAANFDTPDVGGSVGSLINTGSRIDNYKEKLEKLANAIAEEINGLYTGEGKFFKDLSNASDSKTLNNNKIIELDDNASVDPQIALEAAQLRNKKIDSLGEDEGITFESYYQDLMVTIGEESNSAGQLLETYEAIGDQLFAQRESVSGVSIEEEMTNLLQYQYGYQAASKIITTIDQMLETLLGIIR
ncbi:flagellar hook-associated protein FlgK [Desulfofarcimen acetoxidans DSM 771]|uniref:Flagellar hook-associated protein 1 n=1 Tax=Desulfofarcimen acetoxidans (strain ATCC 49208 / DSM 771 / KCTC 5769 / VKM B-1644 / 5575) TaxID=485916 RepID=C8W1E2_DESAS|nr:flagellar hook-associated protein FlgK [Desulfofarcimen acetoxidans]ACV61587.1 flagellar hook-associated protein FlgK [Desulfofarcimen acetoxidans DSM 771]